MNGIDTFLIQYGLAAIFIIMLVKTIGVPIPIPGDLIIFTAAVRSAPSRIFRSPAAATSSTPTDPEIAPARNRNHTCV